jgi:hypothetical protein
MIDYISLFFLNISPSFASEFYINKAVKLGENSKINKKQQRYVSLIKHHNHIY